MRIRRVIHLFACALMVGGVLVGLSGVTSPAARAVPGPDTDVCVPQPVSAADAELSGTLWLMQGAVVGLESRIAMTGAGLRLPDPRCDGEFITVPLTYSWSVTARPAGSTAVLTQTTSLTPRLTPDRDGMWQVTFTACPSRCAVPTTNISIPPLARTIDINAIMGVEGRMSSDELASAIHSALRGTRIQISHTSAGTNVAGTPYTVRWTIPYTKYRQLCIDPEDDKDPNTNAAPICALWEEEGLSGQVTYHTFTPQLTSYIDFGGVAETFGAPPVLLLPIGPYDHDIPTWKRAAFQVFQVAAGLVVGLDIDRVRLMVNNVNVNLVNIADYPVSIGAGGINLTVKFDSSHPTIKCEGHFTVNAGYVVTLWEGWADELCPDFDVSRKDLTIKLVPSAVNGALTLLDAQVTVALTPEGVQSALIDLMFDASAKAETRIADKIRARLLEPQTRTDLAEVLTTVLKSKFKDMGRIASAQIVGTDWVVRYEPVTAPVGASCVATCLTAQ